LRAKTMQVALARLLRRSNKSFSPVDYVEPAH